MALFNHRKMLVPYLPEKGFNLTVFIPCFQLYPPSPPPPPPPTDLSLVVTTMICILGSVLLFLFLVVFLYLHITQSRHNSSAAEVTPGYTNRREEEEDEAEERDFSGDHHHHVWRINTSGLHRSVIESITVVGFKKGQGIIDGAECSVCLNEFEQDESLRLLPKCSHAFHINCIDTWLLSHKNCPLCRAPVVLLTETLHQETESGSSNELQGEEEESLGTRNGNVLLSRAQSDLANHCGSANAKTMTRTFSIGGS